MTTDQVRITHYRRMFVDMAVARQGDHYLWGSAGSIPDVNNQEFPGKPVYLYPDDPDPFQDPYPDDPYAMDSKRRLLKGVVHYKPVVRAAWCQIDPKRGPMVCAGRSNHPQIKSLLRCAFDDRDTLKQQITSQASVLFPRPERTMPNNAPGKTNGIVWGESCEGVFHFDCVGLVNWCLTKLADRTYQFEISMLNDSKGATGVTKAVNPPFQNMLPGDILTKGDHHIGIAVDSQTVVQAADTDLGVIVGPLNNSDGSWTHHRRITDRFWQQLHMVDLLDGT